MNRALYFSCFLLALSFAAAEIKNKGWWKHGVFYQVYPRSFMDSDNDGVGDLKGIMLKMDHFVGTGVDGIWLSPIYASPLVDFGYDISDFKSIHPIFGTMEDFEALVARAKELGLKVILDFVPNHTSVEHEWFQKALAGDEKYMNYYIWRDGKNKDDKVPPNNWIRQYEGSAWQYNEKVKKWYLHQFSYLQPDLNYTNPEVQAEMDDVIRFWLGKGIDGFRIDAVSFLFEDSRFLDEPKTYDPNYTDNDYESLKHIYTKDDIRDYKQVLRWRNVLDEYSDAHNEDEKIMMVEPFNNLTDILRYYRYGANVPFDFFFILNVNSSSTAKDFKDTIDNWMNGLQPGDSANWVMGNHDRPRLASRYGNRSDQMLMLEMVLPGVAVTYYGEEIGMTDNMDITFEESVDQLALNAGPEKYLLRSRDPCRTPFQWNSDVNAGFSKAARTWLPVNKNYKMVNLAQQKVDPHSHYNLYRKLTTLRRTSKALQDGNLITRVLKLRDADVLLIAREIAGESVILLISFPYSQKDVLVNLNPYVKTYENTVVLSTNLADKGPFPGEVVNPDEVKLTPQSSILLQSKL